MRDVMLKLTRKGPSAHRIYYLRDAAAGEPFIAGGVLGGAVPRRDSREPVWLCVCGDAEVSSGYLVFSSAGNGGAQ